MGYIVFDSLKRYLCRFIFEIEIFKFMQDKYFIYKVRDIPGIKFTGGLFRHFYFKRFIICFKNNIMKKTLFLFVIVFFTFGILHAQSGWVWQNPYPTGNQLYSIFFANSLTGYAVGPGATLIKTIDAGTSWTNIGTGYNSIYNFFSSVYFTNGNTGYISGGGGGLGSGFILKTTNGGSSWVSSNTGSIYSMFGIFFINENTGFAAGSFGHVMKTTNSGASWTTQVITSANLGPIFFPSANVGYVSGNDSTIYKTTNGGTSWTKIQHAGRSYNGQMFFINENTGFCCTNLDGLKKTTNGGMSWYVSENSDLWNSVHFVNSTTGFICGGNGKVYKTTNTGASWFNTNYTYVTQGLIDLYFADSLNGIATGDEGFIRKSSDGGASWTTINNNIRDSLYSILFTGNIGYTAGGNGTVMKSTNSGLSWVSQSKITSATIISLCLFNPDNVLGVGSGRKIIRTTNGGTNWLSVTAGTYSNNLNSVTKLSNTTAIAVGDYGIIMKSTNTGANWTNITSPVTSKLSSVTFSDSVNGVAVGVSGTILKTTNSGNNWFSAGLNEKTANDLCAVSFIDVNTGLAVGLNGTILKTINGGINWSTKTSGTLDDIISLSINNPVCYATLYSGYVLKSTNLGETWESHYTNSINQLLSVFFNDANTGWITGSGGMILKTTDGGGVFISKISSEIPSNYKLFQNYPNPFNPSTKIKFSVPAYENGKLKTENGVVSLKVYDISGREVALLVNETLRPGEYEVTFDGGNLPSGVYFCRLTAGTYSGVIKMLLVK